MHPLPQTGVLTFVFTDIEGSTTRWDRAPDAMAQALATHDAIVSEILQTHGGTVFKRVGDAFCCVFPSPVSACVAVVETQRKLASQPWDRAVGELRVRVGVHTGNALAADDDYFGPALNRTARVMSAGHGGQVLLSSATEALVRGELPPDFECRSLGTKRLRDLAEPETIFQLSAPGLRREFPALRTLDARPNNLPLELSSFVGRETELRELRELLATKRLITLCGPGGIGKTRLALHAAAELLDEFPDGVWIVRLAAASDPALIAQTIASALDIGEAAGEPLEATLLRDLAHKRLLLVLDNAEHLMPAIGRTVKHILDRAKDVRVVTTSRESLHVPGEQIYRLGPVGDEAASRLFIERAQAAVHDFDPARDPQDLAAVAQALQGMPLAIELAAARLSTLSLSEIRARLGSQLALLRSSGAGDARHGTLRETIAWSYELLAPPERALLGALSVFSGGFTLAACEAAAPEPAEAATLDLLEALVDKSFLAPTHGTAETRYRMLDVIGEFARERSDPDLLERARERHFKIYCELAGKGAGILPRDDLGSWLCAIDCEIANVRTAIAYGFGHPGAELGGVLKGMYRYWYIRRTIKEGRAWLARFIEERAQDGALPGILRRASALAGIEGEYAEADTLAKRALTLYHERSERAGILEALHALAVNESRRGNYAGAEKLYCDIAERCTEPGEERAAVTSRANCAAIKLQRNDLEAAAGLLGECTGAAEALGDADVSATVTALAGTLELKRGEYERAAAFFGSALAVKRQLKNEFGESEILAAMAVNSVRSGRAADAAQLAVQSLESALRVDSPGLAVTALESLALALVTGERPDRARDAFELARAVRRIHRVNEQTSLGHDEAATKLRERFGEPGDAFALNAGWKAAALDVLERARDDRLVTT